MATASWASGALFLLNLLQWLWVWGQVVLSYCQKIFARLDLFKEILAHQDIKASPARDRLVQMVKGRFCSSRVISVPDFSLKLYSILNYFTASCPFPTEPDSANTLSSSLSYALATQHSKAKICELACRCTHTHAPYRHLRHRRLRGGVTHLRDSDGRRPPVLGK
jgi:hypothetical protein